MKLTLQRESEIPLYRQVVEQVRDYIRSGVLAPGSRLPTVRQLAGELGLTRLTVQNAYAELQAEGLIEGSVGRGTFVAERSLPPVSSRAQHATPAPPVIPWMSQGLLADMLRMNEHPNLLSLASAIPAPETYPLDEFKRSMRAALDDPSALGYGPTQGEAVLREQVAQLLLDRGVVALPDHVIITAGAQQGIDIVLRGLTTQNDVVLVEEPTYPGLIELAAQRGQRLVGIPIDRDGLVIDALEAACQAYHPRLLYTIATFHNPIGISLSAERRRKLLQLARTYNFLIVEDDVYGFLAYGDPAPPALKAEDPAEQVIYLTSFSKSLTPGLRLGAVVPPTAYMAELLAAKRSSDLICSPVLQRGLADFLRRRPLSIHLQHVRWIYRERLDAMASALERHMPHCTWTRPEGGLSVWVTLPEGLNERDFYIEAIERGVGIAPGSAFFGQPQRRAHMRLSFGAQPPSQIEQAITILGGLVRDHLRRQSLLTARAGRESDPLV